MNNPIRDVEKLIWHLTEKVIHCQLWITTTNYLFENIEKKHDLSVIHICGQLIIHAKGKWGEKLFTCGKKSGEKARILP